MKRKLAAALTLIQQKLYAPDVVGIVGAQGKLCRELVVKLLKTKYTTVTDGEWARGFLPHEKYVTGSSAGGFSRLPRTILILDNKTPINLQSLPDNGLLIKHATTTLKVPKNVPLLSFGTTKNCDVRFMAWRTDGRKTRFTFSMGDEKASVLLKGNFPERAGLTIAAVLCLSVDEDYTLKEGSSVLSR